MGAEDYDVIEYDILGDGLGIERHLVEPGMTKALCGLLVPGGHPVAVSWGRARSRCEECVEELRMFG